MYLATGVLTGVLQWGSDRDISALMARKGIPRLCFMQARGPCHG